ncbi:MAG: class I SAM-dependent methyltransferase [Caldilineales bacterium]|nr:class I SAM-dependent methyltransferase [Caldilineales bacterium]
MNHADHVRLLANGVPAETGQTWADLGAGRGAFTLALADCLGPGNTLIAVDKDRRALDALARSMRADFPQTKFHSLAADFTRPMDLSPLDGIVIANALHFVKRRQQADVVEGIRWHLKPGGRLILVEYNTDRGNHWVPHPLSFGSWAGVAQQAGFTHTELLATHPSSFLGEFFAGVSW